MLVDYVGRYEEIEKVKNRIRSEIKNPSKNNNNIVKSNVRLTGYNVMLPHLRTSIHGKKKEEILIQPLKNDTIRNQLIELYEKDFSSFNYSTTINITRI